jgi:hypothetical protein
MTSYAELFTALALPFETWEVKSRDLKRKDGTIIGQALYTSARTVMNRLDQVLGPENWEPAYTPMGNGAYLCRLTITLPDGRKVTKEGIGGVADMDDAGDNEKSGASDALKIAASHFGVGRYIWRDGVPVFAREDFNREEQRILNPVAEAPPPPREVVKPTQPARKTTPAAVATHPALVSGKALYDWCRSKNFLAAVAGWGRDQGYPSRMLDWSLGQRAAALEYAEHLLDSALKPSARVG